MQGLTGVRFDAIDQTLYIDSKIGKNIKSFLSTETGYGTVGLRGGKPFIDIKWGHIPVKYCIVSGAKMEIEVISVKKI